MNIPDRHEILKAIWQRSEGRNVFTPSLTPTGWVEGEAHNPNLTVAPPVSQSNEHYFSPLRFDGPRQKPHVGRPGVIFADLDGAAVPDKRPPSVLIESSPDHYHAYWFLHEPVDPAEWEPHARGWSYEIGADKGGWDLTQVLRQPGTLNHKYRDLPEVKALSFNPLRLYDLDQFPSLTTVGAGAQPVWTPNKSTRDWLLMFYENRLPLSVRYWLTATVDEIKALGTIDRSKIMWQVERQLLEAHFDSEEVFHLIWYAGVNKWSTPAELIREIRKAAAV